jgi:putative ATPase
MSDLESSFMPLAARARPASINEYVGQQHLLDEGKPIRIALDHKQLHSMILWGPPGTGKTTLARLFAETVEADFQSLSAVMSGVKDIREAVARAKQQQQYGIKTILFVDEVHRFNKSQQDAFLPFVEDGTIVFIGATTENPSFEVNSALLSRTRVYVLKSLTDASLIQVINNALKHDTQLKQKNIRMGEDVPALIAGLADGDARRALNILEVAVDLSDEGEGQCHLNEEVIAEVAQTSLKRFDKGGDRFYEQISALHKAVRGSSVDASLYWFVRMLDGGCDPLYIARRVVRMASEDIGNADPRALRLALDAWDVQHRLGSPEGELALAQAIIYLAAAPKSNAVYNAFNAAQSDVSATPDYEVPMHIRNAPTSLMKDMNYGADYRYAHSYDEGFVAGESYLPEPLAGKQYYFPVQRGLEIRIAEKLDELRKLDESSDFQRWATGSNAGDHS